MPHFIGERDAVPTGNAVMMTQAHIKELKDFIREVVNDLVAVPPAVLSDGQFAELKAMLQPGFELSKRMLDEQNRERGLAPAPATPSAHIQADAEQTARLNAERVRFTADANSADLGTSGEPKPVAASGNPELFGSDDPAPVGN